ncbi:MAG: energy transducer TonB [Rhizomicrobium sp.]|jgi:TonB family protein
MRWGFSVLSFTLVAVLSAPAAAELCTPVPAHFSAHPASIGAPHTCSEDYPASALRSNEEGDADIEFFIKADGSVRSPRIHQSSGYADLDNAAMACVLRFTYRPAIQNGKPVEVPWITRVRFRFADWQLYAAAPPSPNPVPPRKSPKHAKPDRRCIPIAAQFHQKPSIG